MSLSRVALVVVQALCNHVAFIPPNPTLPNCRYHTDEMYILQIAPLIFKCHQIIAWGCTVFEVLHYFMVHIPVASQVPGVNTMVCLPSQSNIRLTPFFVMGFLAAVLGTYIRLDCFRTLGKLFTFDLTIHPDHKLITSRFYSYVRHPAYTGSILLVFGLTFSHLTRGSWLTECGPLRIPGSAIAVWALWWLWTLCVGVSRADAEDKQMHMLFKEEWDSYASNVYWWFFPGLL